jgi:hypothetical protein
MMSVARPGPVATINLIGRAGQFCADACQGLVSPAATNTSTQKRARRTHDMLSSHERRSFAGMRLDGAVPRPSC